ncbi:hypothetical protein GCM10028806_34310 [Spirosoma terrae]|uniref:Uncharacterized protein n=1 Tax=Spirosoma terrae TaxID=1968276 RepID=A0A6L9L5H9_9BACT|nr:hypothetical protein [Spirosoma terrae]NDU95744.1 hypothetical protein [Spirosoma terrae]
MNQGKLNQGQRITLVTNNPTLFAGVDKASLGLHQIGIFQSNGKGQPFKGTTTPKHAKGAEFRIALGMDQSYDPLVDRALLPNWVHQTIDFKASEIVAWRGIKAKPSSKEPIVALGYDGSNDLSKTITANRGENLKVYIYLKGTPVQRLTNKNIPHVVELYIDAKTIGPCDDLSGKESGARLQQAIYDAYHRATFGSVPISRLASCKKITKYTTPPSAGDITTLNVYQVTVVDDGSEDALGSIQGMYPALVIKRVKRDGLNTTYQTIKTGAAPADTTASSPQILDQCASCPAGWTAVDGIKAFEFTVPAGTATGSLPALTGQISRKKVRTSTSGDTYLVYVDNDTNTDTVLTSGASATTIAYLGISRDICRGPAGATYSWAAAGTRKKISRAYRITLQDTACGTDRLLELQARYPTLTVSSVTTGQCVHVYETTVLSDNSIVDGCALEDYTFSRPASFDGMDWEPVLPVPGDETGVNYGLIFEGARFKQTVTQENFPYTGRSIDDDSPVYIEISTHSHDYTSSPDEPRDIPFTVLQTADRAIGKGSDIVEAELDSLSYFLKEYAFDPRIREVFGNKFVTDPSQFYDEYQLTLQPSLATPNIFGGGPFQIMYRFFYPMGKGLAFAEAINGLIASANPELPLVHI